MTMKSTKRLTGKRKVVTDTGWAWIYDKRRPRDKWEATAGLMFCWDAPHQDDRYRGIHLFTPWGWYRAGFISPMLRVAMLAERGKKP